MKKGLIIAIIIAVIIIGLIVFFYMNRRSIPPISNNATLVLTVGQTNGGLINMNDPNTWLSSYYDIYSDCTVKLEEKYGGQNNTKKSKYKISEQKYNELTELLKKELRDIRSSFLLIFFINFDYFIINASSK